MIYAHVHVHIAYIFAQVTYYDIHIIMYCTYIYICMYVCMHAYIHVHSHLYAYVYIHYCIHFYDMVPFAIVWSLWGINGGGGHVEGLASFDGEARQQFRCEFAARRMNACQSAHLEFRRYNWYNDGKNEMNQFNLALTTAYWCWTWCLEALIFLHIKQLLFEQE